MTAQILTFPRQAPATTTEVPSWYAIGYCEALDYRAEKAPTFPFSDPKQYRAGYAAGVVERRLSN